MQQKTSCTAILVGLAITVASIGCQQRTPDVAIDGAGDRQPAEETLVGTWQGTMELDEAAAKKEFDEATLQTLKSMHMTVEFLSDGTMKMSAEMATPNGPFSNESSGTWKVLSEEGELVTLQSTEEDGTAEEVELRIADKDTFLMDTPGENNSVGQMRFRRR